MLFFYIFAFCFHYVIFGILCIAEIAGEKSCAFLQALLFVTHKMNKLFIAVVLGLVAFSCAVKPIKLDEFPFQQRHFPEWVDRVPVSNVSPNVYFI